MIIFSETSFHSLCHNIENIWICKKGMFMLSLSDADGLIIQNEQWKSFNFEKLSGEILYE